MKTADMLKLTDDEVCALALQYEGVLRPPLPTIDETSQVQLAAGVLRGRRSLVVRDLADAGGAPLGDALEVFKRLSAGPRAMFAFVDADDNWLRAGFTAYLYGSSVTDVEMSQVIADAGVHYFRFAPPPGQWQALTLLAESIYADGFADPPGQRGRARPAAALLHVVRPDGIRLIRVARGTVTTGRGPVPAQFPSVPEAIAWLLA
jgi:hypothetical protein